MEKEFIFRRSAKRNPKRFARTSLRPTKGWIPPMLEFLHPQPLKPQSFLLPGTCQQYQESSGASTSLWHPLAWCSPSPWCLPAGLLVATATGTNDLQTTALANHVYKGGPEYGPDFMFLTLTPHLQKEAIPPVTPFQLRLSLPKLAIKLTSKWISKTDI